MKKNFIIYTFIIFLLTSFTVFAEREVDFEKLKYDEKTGLVYLEGEKEAFTGIAKQYYEDKSLKIEFPYKNGKMEVGGKSIIPVVNLNLMHFSLMVYYKENQQAIMKMVI